MSGKLFMTLHFEKPGKAQAGGQEPCLHQSRQRSVTSLAPLKLVIPQTDHVSSEQRASQIFLFPDLTQPWTALV